VTCKVGKIKEVLENSIVLSSGEHVPADVIVFAYGLKYQAEPECLKELGIGNSASLCAVICMQSSYTGTMLSSKEHVPAEIIVFVHGLKKKGARDCLKRIGVCRQQRGPVLHVCTRQ